MGSHRARLDRLRRSHSSRARRGQPAGFDSSPRPRVAASPRRAFTLIELLVSISIIAILIAILVPTLGAARRRVQDGKARVEITAFESAITEFRTLHGSDPPSGILLYEEADAWDARSRGLISQMWPNFRFDQPHDINRDGTTSGQVHTLTGAECLVFFLGGLPDVVTVPPSSPPIGFSKDPADPFKTGGARDDAVFEFASDRFTDVDLDGFPEYLGPFSGQSAPFLYASSYGGKGYEAADLVVSTAPALEIGDVYREPDGTPLSTTDNPPYKRTSFQIIFPGADNLYGDGGVFDPANPQGLTNPADHDNITNFHSGRLVP